MMFLFRKYKKLMIFLIYVHSFKTTYIKKRREYYFGRASLMQYFYLLGLSYTSATLGSAFWGTLPAITFILALIFRYTYYQALLQFKGFFNWEFKMITVEITFVVIQIWILNFFLKFSVIKSFTVIKDKLSYEI